MKLINEIINQQEQISQWRQDLHKIPELAFQEHKTADYIETILRGLDVTIHPRMAGTGLIASITSGKSDKTIALRADIDALPIDEKNELGYCSTHSGCMHACGHDGHSAMLLGAVQYLSKHRNFDGTVYFIFQPAEENEGGGRKLVEEGIFTKFKIDAIYGMHNWPGIEVGKFATRTGALMAAYDVFDIQINGKGGHAAKPHMSIDPIIITAQLITALQHICSRQTDPLESAVVSITRVRSGEGYNVIPQTARLSGTVRTFSAAIQENIIQQIQQISESICQAYGATCTINYRKCYPATINDEIETQQAIEAIKTVVGEDNLILDNPPSMGSEDFSFLVNECQGSYVHIGNGQSASLHNDHYNFNDQILTIGASYWVTLVKQQLI
ncbi:MAG: amidohydrolase [Gammaproteobacteria bacterium]|nr:amidohydrolase [Gammaproteobacteria bacterium]